MTKDIVSVGVYFVEWWIAYLFFNSIFEAKYSRVRTAFCGLLLYLIAALEYVFLFNPILNSASVFFVNILYVYLFYYQPRIKGLISVVVYSALLNLSEWITIQVLAFITGTKFGSIISNLPMYILGSTISKTLLLLFSIFVAKIAFPYKASSSSNQTPAFLFVFPISVLIIDFTFWTIASQNELSLSSKTMVIVGSTVMLVSVLLTYVFYGNAMSRNQEFIQLQSEYRKVQIDKEYYHILDHQNEVLRTYIHDEKKHLSALKSLNSIDDIHSYIDSIIGEIHSAAPVGNTKNKMLDLMLGKYTYQCNLKGIIFSYSTITANLSFMEDTDLVSMVSNILDNAVEATEFAQNKWITLTLESKVKGMTILTCLNSSSNPPITRRGKLCTSRKSSKQHGIGIKSIVRTAKKYDGEFEWSWDDQNMVFTAKVIFER